MIKKLLGIVVLGLLWCNVAVALSQSTKNNIINTIESNAMVSKAKFGHDEVGGDSSYTIFWIWMPEISGKDYNAIADYFCPVFKVNGRWWGLDASQRARYYMPSFDQVHRVCWYVCICTCTTVRQSDLVTQPSARAKDFCEGGSGWERARDDGLT